MKMGGNVRNDEQELWEDRFRINYCILFPRTVRCRENWGCSAKVPGRGLREIVETPSLHGFKCVVQSSHGDCITSLRSLVWIEILCQGPANALEKKLLAQPSFSHVGFPWEKKPWCKGALQILLRTAAWPSLSDHSEVVQNYSSKILHSLLKNTWKYRTMPF